MTALRVYPLKICIIIPCFNERLIIEKAIDTICAAPIRDKETILIDDCSIDGAKEIFKQKVSSRVDKVIYRAKNLRKGTALRSGIAAASGDIVIIFKIQILNMIHKNMKS